MGRVFYMRNVREHEVASYEALGWTESGRKLYALDEVSVCMSWEREGDPVEPEPPRYEPTTRDVMRWNFAAWDLICAIGLALAGLVCGAFEWIFRSNMIRWFFVIAGVVGALSACADHSAALVVLDTFSAYLWAAHPPTSVRS